VTATTPAPDRERAISELAGLDMLIDVARQDLDRLEARAAQKALHLVSMVTIGRGVMCHPDTRIAWGDWCAAATAAECAHDEVQRLHSRRQELREALAAEPVEAQP
jgi:hypothetical protein